MIMLKGKPYFIYRGKAGHDKSFEKARNKNFCVDLNVC